MFNSNASSAGGGANYIEDVFSTYLYAGTSANQTIANNIDLATKGGLVWSKRRSGAESHVWLDTARNNGSSYLASDDTGAQGTAGNFIQSFNSNGYSIGSNNLFNNSGTTNVSWTFAEQPKFFDVVTYTGTGVARTVAHSLGSVPGCIIIKRTNTSGSNWVVYHRGLNGGTNPEQYYISLNLTDAQTSTSSIWNNTAPTNSVFTVGTAPGVNNSGDTFVAYLFAHDAGGFGLTGTDNVISCGSFTTDGSGNATVSLGYEPQWVLIKRTDGAQNWLLNDVMRGMSLGQTSSNVLFPNTSDAEYTAWSASPVLPNATGFVANGSGSGGLSASANFIYIAIRRGPMKVPTTGTSVFSPQAVNVSTGTQVTTSFPVDMQIQRSGGRSAAGENFNTVDRLRGVSTNTTASGQFLQTNNTNAEGSGSVSLFFNSTGFQMPAYIAGQDDISWNWRRAPSFFDEVCYTGTGGGSQQVNHNLGVAPELALIKRRSATGDWEGYGTNKVNIYNGLNLNLTNAASSTTSWSTYSPYFTSTFIDVAVISNSPNAAGSTYVAYLFATCPGVSKVGSYTGTAATQIINCGFTGGARFVLIKRTDSTGDWYVWDSARGIVAGNDPYLLLNSTAAEVTGTDYVDTAASGFELSSTAPAAINASGGTYLFLAIA
jgi:hypothetical protein